MAARNATSKEGQHVLSAVLRQEKQGRRAGGGRQIGGGRVVNLQDWAKMLTLVDDKHVKAGWKKWLRLYIYFIYLYIVYIKLYINNI